MKFQNPLRIISEKMRPWIMVLWLAVLFSGIANVFWYNEWKFSLPTPVPINYHEIKTGTYINLAGRIQSEGKPLLLHFFNPACPCSRFNIPDFISLTRQYDTRIDFAVVVINKEKKYTVDEICETLRLNVPVLFDTSLAAECGVYSTPQAVILDSKHHLYYRGNYNKSRYCTDKNSRYAQMAIDSLLKNSAAPALPKYALQAYGCELPTCLKNKK